MGLGKLLKMLGLDDGSEEDVTAAQAGLTDDEMGDLRQQQKLRDLGLEPAPPSKEGAYRDSTGGMSFTPDGGNAERMFNAEADVGQRRNKRSVDEAMALLDSAARRLPRDPNALGLMPTSPERNAQFEQDEAAQLEQQPQPAPVRKRAPQQTGATISEKEQLAAAFKKAGVPSDDMETSSPAAQELNERADVETPQEDATELKRRPLGVTGPAALPATPNRVPPQEDDAGYQAQLHDPNRRIFDQKALAAMGGSRGAGEDRGSGGAIGDLSKLLAGNADPRMAELKASLAERERLLRQADAETQGGIGADIAGGTHFNTDAGAGTRRLAEAKVDSARIPMEERRKEGDYQSRQLDAEQQRGLRTSAETRAQQDEVRREAGEGRAVSEEGRKSKAFDVTAARSDASSSVSKNARAEMETLYGAQWNRIPKEVRDAFTADDVDRFFREASAKDLASGQRSGAQSLRQQIEDDRNLTDFEKHLVEPGSVDAYNRIAGRLEDPEPIMGMSGGRKALTNALGSIPVMGKGLKESATGALNSLTPEGQALYQDAIRVMQDITLQTTGKAMNETELARIEARIGMSSGNENDFRNAMRHEMEAVQAKAERQLQARNPRVQSMARERGIMPRWKKRGGGARPYALETEGRFNEADESAR